MAKKPKETLTFQYLNGPPPDGIKELGQPGPPPSGRTPIPRLGFSPSPKLLYSPEKMAKTIRNASLNSFSSKQTFFICDTNMFIQDVEEVIWDALLDAKVLMIPAVWRELENVWMGSPKYNGKVKETLLRDFQDQDNPNSHFTFFQLPESDSEVINAAKYYVNLLFQRKRALDYILAMFEKKYGKPPTTDELQKFANEQCGERGYQLAVRATKNPGRPFPFADEELIVTAIFFSLFTMNEVVILTRDAGVQEQFYKFFWLLDTHYRGMLLAEDFLRDSTKYQPLPIAEWDERLLPGFVGQDNLLLFRTPEQLEAILPKSYDPLPIYCWLMGESGGEKVCSMLNFCAEGNMQEIVRMKGRTNGRNTDLFGNRNSHVYLYPLNFQPLGSYSIIAEDRICRFRDNFPIPWLDLHHSIFKSERFRRIESDLVT